MEVGILPDKRVQSKVIKMLIELRKSMNTLRTSIRDRKYLTSTTFNCGVGKDSWESLGLQGDSTGPFWMEISPGISLEGVMLKLKLQYFGHLMRRVDSLEKTDGGRDLGQEEKGTTEDEMAEWYHWLDGTELIPNWILRAL